MYIHVYIYLYESSLAIRAGRPSPDELALPSGTCLAWSIGAYRLVVQYIYMYSRFQLDLDIYIYIYR